MGTAAPRTAGGFPETLTTREGKSAAEASRWLDGKITSACGYGTLQMLEMSLDLALGESELLRE